MSLTFVDELPQQKGPGGRRRSISDEMIAEMRRNLGKWALVKEFDETPGRQNQCHSYAQAIKKYLPEDIEVAVRDRKVYARAVQIVHIPAEMGG